LPCDVTITLTNLPRPGYTPPPPDVSRSELNIVLWLKNQAWCYRDACNNLPIVEISKAEIVLLRSATSNLTISQSEGALKGYWELSAGEGRAVSTIEGRCRTATILPVPSRPGH
jgi:hypothetical protein